VLSAEARAGERATDAVVIEAIDVEHQHLVEVKSVVREVAWR
jgi:hypothetical protein